MQTIRISLVLNLEERMPGWSEVVLMMRKLGEGVCALRVSSLRRFCVC